MNKKTKIIKRQQIDDSIIKELQERYPLQCSKNGVVYKQKLDYLTFEPDFLFETEIRDLKAIYKDSIITLIFYIRTKMCLNGWYVRVDGNNLTYLLEDCAKDLKISKKRVNEMLDAIINKKIFSIVSDETVMEGKYLTCSQQIYNYEMAANNRKRARGNDCETNDYQEEKAPLNASPIPTNPINCTVFPLIEDDPFGVNK